MLSIKNLSVKIEEISILQDLNLEIEDGQVCAVMGPNGAGKSTLAQALMGHPQYEVTEGKILLAGALQSIGAESNDHLAVRPGIIYTSTGTAQLGLPAGKYTIIAGRGFEYSVHQVEVDLNDPGHAIVTLGVRREVPTDGYVACDTHVHTRTHSGHGDATVQERMIT